MNKLAATARGEIPAELVIHNANIANVYTQSYELSDIAIYSGRIAGVGRGYTGLVNYDAEGRALIPGMIDGHAHIESTMMAPPAFAQAVALHGTSTVMADPHEISNVLGMAGIEYMFRASQGLPVDIFYGAPSCVPASDYETPYDELDMNAVASMFRRGWAQHLGEVMNFPAVIGGDPEIWGKILAAGNVPLTGHAPGVSGYALNAYVVSGINSDHECTTLTEAREKLSRGMWLMIREGASFPDLKTLLPLIRENPLYASRCMAVSDDLTARYITERGHMDEKMRIMIREGIDPFTALRMVTLTPAEYFRLYDRGGIAPGLAADFSILDAETMDETFRVSSVWKNGRQVVRDNDVFTANDTENLAPVMKVRVKKIPTVEEIRIKSTGSLINVIGVTEGSVITQTLKISPKVEDGCVVPDASNDTAKIIVLERHRDTGKFGVGFVHGLGITRGAIGSSVAHDAHNFVAAGADDRSILTALHGLAEMGGGLIVSEGDKITASFALPIGGLMSYLSPEEIASNLEHMETAASSLGGVKIAHPFMVLSFLCLSVIPELRITDRGYIDITKGGLQPLFVR
ncbi:MAG: adenine deaminase [Synergistaceae bacterium]|nr:adenine deaminase [Synergistaceae bacterium]